MICPKCGFHNIEEASFCGSCGSPLKDIRLQETVNLTPVQPEITNLSQIKTDIFPSQEVDMNDQSLHTSPLPMNVVPNKKKTKNQIILIIILILLIICGVIAFFYLKKGKQNDKDIDINYSSSFFIKGENKKYAMFNENGKQLTDFIYKYSPEFINGSALARKDDDSYEVINESGKVTVESGEYKNIYRATGMYEVYKEDGKKYLIDGNGKVLYDLENMKLKTYPGEYSYSLLKDMNTNTYKVLDYKGKPIVSFPIEENEQKSPSIQDESDYISVFYHNKNYILNPIASKEVVSFDADIQYCINAVEEDGKIITMNSCVSFLETQEKVFYKFIKNGKLYDFTDRCDKVYYSSGSLICYKDSTRYFMDDKLNIGVDVYNKAYADNDSYAIHKSFEGVSFYKNGKLVNNVACRSLTTGYMKNGLFILDTYKSDSCGTEFGTYEFYNSNGENAFGKSFRSVDKFDNNGLAKVSDDNEKYYLINMNGKKVSGEYEEILFNKGYYPVNNNSLYGLLDSKGNIVFDCSYGDIGIIVKKNRVYAVLETTDSKYVIYDMKAKREVLTLDDHPSFEENYMYVAKDDKVQYYTYKGKLFYESN